MPGSLTSKIDAVASEFRLPSREELEQVFREKYGDLEEVGWSPKRRFHWGYYLPAEMYEAVVKRHVFQECTWIDVGGGHSVFPDNPQLARSLVTRCSFVVAVDPSDNVNRNSFVHQRSQCPVDAYETDRRFDLATLRMVVEHVTDPEKMIQSLSRLLRPGGVAIVFTVNRFSPITILSRLIPFKLHHPIKRLFWGGEEQDTFPVHYKMNTRRSLRRLFEANGFAEHGFAYLDDLSALSRFRYLHYFELILWRVLCRVGIPYPENCLLGVYQKRSWTGHCAVARTSGPGRRIG